MINLNTFLLRVSICGFALLTGEAHAAVLFTFDASNDITKWTFDRGGEYPGARGQIAPGAGGANNYAELQYDFTPPANSAQPFNPHYVQAITQISAADGANVSKLRLSLQLKDATVTPYIRLSDSTGQVFQYSPAIELETASLTGWRSCIVDLSTAPLFHWGGNNDGTFHLPLRQLSIIADATGSRTTGWLRFDNIETLAASPVQPISPLSGILSPASNTSTALTDIAGVCVHTMGDTHALDIVSTAGFRWIRIDAAWKSIEKKAGIYDFSGTDALVTAAESRQLHTILILDYGNVLYTAGEMTPPLTQTALAAYGNFCEAMARHYSGRDVTFEIWNEPDLNGFWGGKANAAQYGNVLKQGVSRVKIGSPQTKVLTGGLSSLTSVTSTFWDTLQQNGALSNADGLGTHLYNSSSSPESEWTRILSTVSRANTSLPGKSLWCTEWGYSSTALSASKNGNDAAARKKQASFATRQLLLGWWANLPLVMLYDIKDDGADPTNNENNFGLCALDYSEKPAMTAVRTLLTISKNRFLQGLVNADGMPAGMHMLQLRGTKNTVFIIWSEDGVPSTTLLIPNREARLWDMFGQRIGFERLSTEQSFILTPDQGPIYIEVPSSGT